MILNSYYLSKQNRLYLWWSFLILVCLVKQENATAKIEPEVVASTIFFTETKIKKIEISTTEIQTETSSQSFDHPSIEKSPPPVKETEEESTTTDWQIIVGASVGIPLVCFLVLVFIFYLLKRTKRRKPPTLPRVKQIPTESTATRIITNNERNFYMKESEQEEYICDKEPVYENVVIKDSEPWAKVMKELSGALKKSSPTEDHLSFNKIDSSSYYNNVDEDGYEMPKCYSRDPENLYDDIL